MNAEVRKLLRLVQGQGFTVERTRKSHLKITAPSGEITYCSGTPSCPRSLKNTRADLKRMGATL